MAIQQMGNGGVLAEVGGTTFRGWHMHSKPLEYGALGHYAFMVRIASTAAQAANSRILEIRNTATNLIIPISLKVKVFQTAAGTAQENSLDLFKCTGFTAVDTTNTVTPTSSVKRTTAMAAFPGGAAVRHLTLAGAAAGMTGGTLTKDANALYTMPYLVAAAASTIPLPMEDFIANVNAHNSHPLTLLQNEGIELENRVLNVTSFGVTWYLYFEWAEVGTF